MNIPIAEVPTLFEQLRDKPKSGVAYIGTVNKATIRAVLWIMKDADTRGVDVLGEGDLPPLQEIDRASEVMMTLLLALSENQGLISVINNLFGPLTESGMPLWDCERYGGIDEVKLPQSLKDTVNLLNKSLPPESVQGDRTDQQV